MIAEGANLPLKALPELLLWQKVGQGYKSFPMKGGEQNA